VSKVKEAAERALEKYKQEHPDVDETAIKVDLPPAPPPAPQAVPGLPFALPQVPYMGVNAAYIDGAYQNRLQILRDQMLGQQNGANPALARLYQDVVRIQARQQALAALAPAPALAPPAAAPRGANFLPANQVHNHGAQAPVPRVGMDMAQLPQVLRRNPPRNQPIPMPLPVRKPNARR
jgi:E3 ubiquitin-protein ligase RNF216